MNPTPRNLPTRWLMLALTGALALAPAAWSQTTPSTNAAPPAETNTPVEATDKAKASEEKVVLSPFIVSTSKDAGYFAGNTLAGSRLNTNVTDLASAITIVTKQQLVDTSAIDINDVFMYEASTEGANTYTQTDVSRNGIPRDTISGFTDDTGTSQTRTTANRVRGLSAPDLAQNNYPSITRIPIDSYNTNSLEISRGPNSLLFGTGSPAGIVNQSTAQAILNQRKTSLEYRGGSWDDQRFVFSHNQPILEDKIAIYLSGLYQSAGYRRKPSEDVTRRQYGAITLQPFKKTRITASYEHFDNHNSRPNSQTPRDYVSTWLGAGKPYYDPVTRTVTIQSTGQVLGPYVTDTRSPGWIPGTTTAVGTLATAPTNTVPNSLYVPGIVFNPTGSARLQIFTDQGALEYAQIPNAVAFTTLLAPYTAYNAPTAATRTPAQWQIADRRLTSSTGPVAPAGIGTYIQPSTTDINIYDWEHINLLQMNYQDMKASTYNVELMQEILPNLNFAAGWFKQHLASVDNFTVSNANAITTLFVDTNKNNLDGTPNPHFGNPYLADIQADTWKTPEDSINYRAMLAYEFDLTKLPGIMRFLGHHRLLGLWSSQDNARTGTRSRLSFDGGDIRYQANPTAANAIIPSGNIGRVFYVGNNANGVVNYAPGLLGQPGYGGPSEVTVHTYNWSTAKWEDTPLHMSQDLFYPGAYYNQKVIVGKSAALSSYFWDDRIVTTFGVRKDDYKARTTNFVGTTTTNTGLATDLYSNGLAIDPGWVRTRLTDWYRLSGTTKTSGVVIRALKWSSGDISVHFNKSDNFNPPAGIPVDFFGVPLPKSTGAGKDYGIGVSLFDNKLVARVNWFESNNLNAPATAAATAIGRVSRQDTSNFRSWATFVVRIRHNEDPANPNFNNNTAFPLSTAMKDEIAALMHVPSYDNWPPTGISGTQTNNAKGTEFQLTYNPTLRWSIKLTAAKVKSVYQDVAPQIDAWVGTASTAGSRMNVWTTAVAPDMPAIVTLNGNTPVSLQNFWTGYGFNADARLSNANSSTPSWISAQGFYESAVATEINVAKALQGKTVPNQREWSFSAVSNYNFQTGRWKGFGVGGAYRWASEAIAGFMGDPNNRDSNGLIVAPDLARPIMVKADSHIDLWVSYRRKVFHDKVGLKLQLNIRDALEGGHLQPVAYNFDGTAFAYRILDPRQIFFTTTFDF